MIPGAMVGVPPAVRYGLVLILTALAVLSGWWSYDVLSSLWGYQDSDPWLYVILALPGVAVLLLCIVGIVSLLRPERSPSKRTPRGNEPAKS